MNRTARLLIMAHEFGCHALAGVGMLYLSRHGTSRPMVSILGASKARPQPPWRMTKWVAQFARKLGAQHKRFFAAVVGREASGG